MPKLPISKRALLARINRKLASEHTTLKATRGTHDRQEFGDYYLLKNNVIADHGGYKFDGFDIEDLGRKLGVLGGHEQLAAQ